MIKGMSDTFLGNVFERHITATIPTYTGQSLANAIVDEKHF